MSIDRIFYCDGPDCDDSVQTDAAQPPGSFLTVTQDDAEPEHFCSWDCLLKRAAAMPPSELVEA
jgi:hypothetical protein